MSNKPAGIGQLITEEHELGTSALDLFSLPPVEATQLQGREQTVYMTTPLTNNGPYEFILPNDSADFIMLDQTTLYGEVEVVDADGVKVKAANTDTTLVNNFPQTLFKQIELYLNGTCVSDLSTPTYAFKAYLENHLSYPEDIKKTTLFAKELYAKDEAGHEGETIAADYLKDKITNKSEDGMTLRHIMARNTIVFNMKLHIDMLGSVRYLIPGVEMKLKLIRNDDKFSILSANGGFKINFKTLQLKVRRITLTPEIAAAIENNLTKEPAKYPIALSKIKTYSINSGNSSVHVSQIINGKLPRSFMFGFVSTEAFDGSMSHNPFMFKHYDLSSLNVYINGEPIHPIALQPKWDNYDCLPEYTRFLDNIGMHQLNTNGITLNDFKSNTCLFCYDLSPDLCNSFYKHPIERGIVDISATFKKALPHNVYLVLFATYDELVLIDKDRSVIMST